MDPKTLFSLLRPLYSKPLKIQSLGSKPQTEVLGAKAMVLDVGFRVYLEAHALPLF